MLLLSSADFFKMNFFKKYFRNSISVSNRLDPDQEQCSVWVLNHLQRFSADNKSRHYFVILHLQLAKGKQAAAWDFQQFDILTSVDSGEHLQPHFKLRNSEWCSVSSLTII